MRTRDSSRARRQRPAEPWSVRELYGRGRRPRILRCDSNDPRSWAAILHVARRVGRGFRAEQPFDDMQRTINARGDAGSGENPAVVDEALRSDDLAAWRQFAQLVEAF